MNLVTASLDPDLARVEVRRVEGRAHILEARADLLRDESRLEGEAVDLVYLPGSTQELVAAMQRCRAQGLTICLSGARTGVVGGAVPKGAQALVSLGQMARVLDTGPDWVRVEAGCTLADLNAHVTARCPGYFYPVDPTETGASLGGNVCTNASGAHSFRYGPTRGWVRALRVVLADGAVVSLRRGEVRADGCTLRFALPGRPEQSFSFPTHSYPATKNTTGVQLRPDMDAVDLFVGAEGTLGAVAEVELQLAPWPPHRLYAVVWTRSEAQTLALVEGLRGAAGLEPIALEYFDPCSLELLKARRAREGRQSAVPQIPAEAVAALFVDLVYAEEAALEQVATALDALLRAQGLSAEDSWSGVEEKDLRRMKELRHALPETVNAIVAQRKQANPALHKLSTDLAAPAATFDQVLKLYRERVGGAGLEYVVFGHIGDGHVHMNLLPRDAAELATAQALYTSLAEEVAALGGSVAGEHGVGRLKRHLMAVQYPPQVLDAMRRLKQILDPTGALNPGVLLPE